MRNQNLIRFLPPPEDGGSLAHNIVDKMIQQMNRVELVGYVGSIRTSQVGEQILACMTVATSTVYESVTGEKVIETNWSQVSCFQKDGATDLRSITKGEAVHVVGRVKNNIYTGADGVDRMTTEVIASFIEKVEGRLVPQEA